MEERLPRKLAAILYADVAGYSRLTGEDEDATHRLLAAYLDQMALTIERHGGRVMHYAGDAVLAMFEAVVDALSCAVQIQRDLNSRNADLPDRRKVQFRIGVNLGDVIEDRGDIYGDGVNVAARLESLAEPGGICLSESVHTAVGNKLPFVYEFLGEKEVKNIARSVRAYHARLEPGAVLPEPRRIPARGNGERRRMVAATATLLVIALGALGALGLLRDWGPGKEPVSVERIAAPLPEQPSVAVLPFINMSDDAQQDYFADGVTEDLITDLSKLSGLLVISRTSTFAYKGKSTGVRQIAEELGVRYVLEGSVRLAGTQMRINAQLIDATTGGHVWAERYDSALSDVFAVQERINADVVSALAVQLTSNDREARDGVGTHDVGAYQAFLQGRAQLETKTKIGLASAVVHFEEALERDPGYANVYGALAETYWHIWNEDYSKVLGLAEDEVYRKGRRYLAEALEQEEPTYQARHVQSMYLTEDGRFDEAVAITQQMIAANPNDPIGYEALGRAANKAGRAAEGLDAMLRARELDPRGDQAGKYAWRIGESLFLLGRYEEAESEFRLYLGRSGDSHWGHMMLAGIYGQLGRHEEARTALDRFNEGAKEIGESPYTLSDFDEWGLAPGVREKYVESLRAAGMPSGD